jgi:hypothetical protein
LRYYGSEISDGVAEVLAYGAAVLIQADALKESAKPG